VPGIVVMALKGSIIREDIGLLCERAQAMLEKDAADLIVCDVREVRSDARAIDALARLQLTAQRQGRRMRVLNACAELRELLVLTGLQEVMSLIDAADEFRFGTRSR
jgi:ABC-type transporter Mla MlaB component